MGIEEQCRTFENLVNVFGTVSKLYLPQGYNRVHDDLCEFARLLEQLDTAPNSSLLRAIDDFLVDKAEQLNPELYQTFLILVHRFCQYLVSRLYLGFNPIQFDQSILPPSEGLMGNMDVLTPKAQKEVNAEPIFLNGLPGRSTLGNNEITEGKGDTPTVQSPLRSRKVCVYSAPGPQSSHCRLRFVKRSNSSVNQPCLLSRPEDRVSLSNLVVLKDWFISERRQWSKRKICDSTAKNYEGHIDQLITFLTDNNFEFLTEDTLKAFITHIQEIEFGGHNLAPNSKSAKKSAISAFLRLLENKRGISIPGWDEILATSKSEKLVRKPHRPLDLDEIDACLKVIKTQSLQLQLEFLIPLLAGNRPCETKEMRYIDIDLASATVILDGKGEKKRVVPIPELFLPFFKRLVDNCNDMDDYIFSSRQSENITTRTLDNHLKDICAKAGLKWVPTCHCLRKTFATNQVRYGNIDAFRLAQLLGHCDVNTSAIYVQTVPNSPDITLEMLYKRWLSLLGID